MKLVAAVSLLGIVSSVLGIPVIPSVARDALGLGALIRSAGSADSSTTPSASESPADSDLRILNFALGIEHLAQAFYASSLAQFPQSEFETRGYPDPVRNWYQQIQRIKDTHVDFLTNTITNAGVAAIGSCEYTFAPTDARDFVEMSAAVENVALSMYTNAISQLQDKSYIKLFGSILGVTARHAAWITSTAKTQNPWNTAYEAPISFSTAWTISGHFIASCPPSNKIASMLPIGIRDFTPLNLPTSIDAGSKIPLDFDDSPSPYHTQNQSLYAAFRIGSGMFIKRVLTDFSVDGASKKTYSVVIPKELKNAGVVFVTLFQNDDLDEDEDADWDGEFVSFMDEEGWITDDRTVAGPVLVMFPFDSEGVSIGMGMNEANF